MQLLLQYDSQLRHVFFRNIVCLKGSRQVFNHPDLNLVYRTKKLLKT